MNRERAKELLPIIEEYSKGGTVQFRGIDAHVWVDLADPDFHGDHGEYRIKPEPHDIKWAAEQMTNGRPVRRRSWMRQTLRCIASGGVAVRFIEYGAPSSDVILMDVFDLIADDWEIYEPK